MIFVILFWEFLLIGTFTFGGGYAMIPLIQQVVLKHHWLNEQQLIDFIAVSESTPGPLAVNMSTYVGVRTAGLPGAFVATLGIILPSFLIILLVSRCYKQFQNSRAVKGAMSGLQPAVVALIGTAVISIFQSVFHFQTTVSKENIVSAGIVCICGFLCYKKVHPILIICISAVIGILGGMINK